MGFYIQDDYWEGVEDLPRKAQDEALGAMVRYFFTGEETQLKGAAGAVFKMARKRIDMAKSKASRQKRWRENVASTVDATKEKQEEHASVSLLNREGEREREDSYESKEYEETRPLDDSLIAYQCLNALNETLGTTYSELTGPQVNTIIGSGCTPEDVRRMVECKRREWGSSQKMRSALKPSVLFGKNFRQYLDESRSTEVNRFAAYAKGAKASRKRDVPRGA